MFTKRLLWKLLFSYTAITLIALLTVTIIFVNVLNDMYIDHTISSLEDRALLIDDIIHSYLNTKSNMALDSVCKVIGNKSQIRITVIQPDGKILAESEKNPDSMDNHADRPEIKEALRKNRGTAIRYSYTLNQELLYFAMPLQSGEKINAILRISVPLTFVEQTISVIRSRIIWTAVIIAMIIIIISFVISRQISQPLEEMKNGVEQFANGQLGLRLAKPNSEELSRLVEAFNSMAELIEEKIQTVVKQKNELSAVLESMVEGVLALDQNEKIINMNPAAARLLNINTDAAIGSNIQEVIRNIDLQTFVSGAISDGAVVEDEIIISNRGKRYLQLHGSVLKNANGETMGAVIVLNDVTRLRRLENIRQEFVANVSHEIRTPLTSIKGFAETLIDGALDDSDSARKFIEIIAKQSNRLNAIIEDLLILARLEQDGEQAQIEFKNSGLRHVINEALLVCSPKATAKNIRIKLNCTKELKIKINSDLIEQALVNLIDNAITYSERNAEVIVEAKSTGSEVEMAVIDHGVGIDRKHLPRLFERFYRVDKARSRNLGGTGLGLAIVKHIAQVHGGRVEVESQPGEGSCFRIYLPKN